ncbi:hypothetical protein PWT90_04053 [Aphanocladium album]|nr:hypothetical protein PWT90_04053 [Aphanocladium album]
MPAGIRSAHGMDTALLHAIFWESDKCATVMDLLSTLRGALTSRTSLDELNTVCHHIHKLRSAMLAFADLFPLHAESIQAFLNHLDMVLPSISKTLDDIQHLCAGRRRFGDASWDRLMNAMFDGSNRKFELDGRFKLYAKFFDVLFLGITQSPKFDWKKAEGIRLQIMDLREDNLIAVPKDLTTVFFPFNQLPAARARRKSFVEHWAVDTVDRRPEFMSNFCKDARGFNKDVLSFTVLINYNNKLPYVLLRTTFDNIPFYECRPLSELRIMRSETKLHLSRWSSRQQGFVHWAVLHFQFFEELVVIQCTLLALKAQTSLLANAISHDETVFRDDTCIWEKDIKDNGVRHKLAIYRDNITGTKRLYAFVAKGERHQAYTPAWTIFFTNRKAKPQMECLGDHRLVVYNAALYTFGDRYLTAKHDPRHFEITFRHSGHNRELKLLFEASYRAMQRYSV